MGGSRIWTKSFIAICICSFFVYLEVFMLSATLPLFVNDVLGGSAQQMGLVISLWTIGVVTFRLFSGRWVDRYGTKKLVMLSIAMFLIATLMYLGASELLPLLVIRVIHGGSFAVAATAMSALAAQILPHTRKGEGIGYFSTFMSMSMVMGPALGIYLIDQMQDSSLLFIVSVMISTLGLVCALLVKSPKSYPPPTVMARSRCSWRNVIEKEALPIAFVGFFLSFAYSSLTSFIPSFTRELHHSQSAGLFFVAFAATIMASRPFVGRLFDQKGTHWIMIPGSLAFMIGMISLSLLPSVGMLLVAAILMGVGYGALFPCFQALAIRSVPQERWGMATSTFFLLFDIGFGIGSFVLGWIAQLADYRIMFLVGGLIVSMCPAIYYVQQFLRPNWNVPKHRADRKGV